MVERHMLYNVFNLDDLQFINHFGTQFHDYDPEFDYEMNEIEFDFYRTKKCDLFCPLFNYVPIPSTVKERFIQLLPSYTLRLFSFTSKKNYIDCLYWRGIEVEQIKSSEFDGFSVASNGRLIVSFKVLNTLPSNWLKFIRPLMYVKITDDDVPYIDIILKNTYLAIEIYFTDPQSLPLLFKFCHPKIRNAHITLKFTISNLEEIIGLFNDIVNLYFHIYEERQNPTFSLATARYVSENWMWNKTNQLERFVFSYGENFMIYYNQQLFLVKSVPRAVAVGYRLYITNDFDNDGNDGIVDNTMECILRSEILLNPRLFNE